MITPELIGPYLAHRPALQTLDGPQVLSIELLTTIENLDKIHPGTKAIFYETSFLRLNDFSALCTPLDDGTVPAEILAGVVKQSSRYTELFLRSGIVIKQIEGEGDENPARVEIWGEHTATAVFTIFSDMTFYTAMQTDYAAVCDTLHRLHFALPVNGKPLLAGRDYLPK